MATNGVNFNGTSESSLLKNILNIDANENVDATLVEMYRDLIFTAERLKTGIQTAVEHDAKLAAERAGEEEEEEEEEKEEEEDDENSEEELDEEDEDSPKRKDKKKKTKRPLSDIAQLLEALSLDKKQKQHLLIKKAILLKFEEALFGNNNITMTLDLRQVGGDGEKDGKLEQILQCRDLTKYIPKVQTENGNSLEFAEKAKLQECVNVAKNPTDILGVLRPKTPKKIASNLIKQQYNIRWNTSSGEVEPFDFYKLEKHFRKGNVRKAYVQTLLYEHKVVLENFRQRLKKDAVDSEDFAPKCIYGKKDPFADKQAAGDEDVPPIRPRDEPKFKWQRWAMLEEQHDVLGPEFPPELKWIDPKVKTLLRKLCEPLNVNFSPYETPSSMYILVIKETTSETLSEMGSQSQIYIGGADEGIKKRFLEGDDCHCIKMKQSFNEISKMEEFKPSATSLLIELRLLLAISRQEPYALFAVRTFEDPRTLGREVHDLITKALYLDNDEIWGPAVNMKFGLNVKEEMKKRRKYLPDHFPGSKRKNKR
uniref:uncharacterized protein LOC120339317 n=1 Tax=Styela clava TaxID=7725 RepID=UPI00193AB625|nr:uncharacterized protein LOC120339317 [Styela clava]XP_039263350.1 uncharacterized protein LOC120339317 [Styela clava]